MAFIDNSGQIILDAVLTEVGRKRMATGNFQIVKFALGDDEINYGLYQKDNPSGSAYYDLEILQSPVFEASTGVNANINYGLVTMPNPFLLYMPVVVRNDKAALAARPTGGMFYLAVNDGKTADALVTTFGGPAAGGKSVVLQAAQRNGTKIILETGLHTTELTGEASNVANFITSQGLRDTSFEVAVDRRFISRVFHPKASSVFNNNAGNGESNIKLDLEAISPTARDRTLKNYSVAIARGVPNNVFRRQNDNRADTATSNITGPRASATALNFDLALMTSDLFQRFGKAHTATGAGASTVGKAIDTMVRVTGNNSGVQCEIPIRIFKKD